MRQVRRPRPGDRAVTARMLDADGHAWPVTGVWCAGCGWPLAPHAPGQRFHPTCEPESALHPSQVSRVSQTETIESPH